MERINLPKVIEEKLGENHSRFTIEPLYPGYGTTVGNSLRRVLLSSITGAAVTSYRVDGISHEFSAVPGVKEDMLEVMMNLKSLSFRSFSDEPVILELTKKGPGEVKASDIKPNSNIELINPDQYIATIDGKNEFSMELTVEKGRGFRPINVGSGEHSEIGRVSIDTLFSPVERVSLNVEDTRVGQVTNYDKLTLEVITNGTVSPDEALKEASTVLVEHYNAIIGGDVLQTPVTEETVDLEDVSETEDLLPMTSEETLATDNKTKIEDMSFSPRTTNALLNAGVKTLGGLKRLSDLKLEEVKGLGKKGIDEIKEYLG